MVLCVTNCFCLLAFAMTGTVIGTSLFSKQSHIKSFFESLDQAQANRYKSIMWERGIIYGVATCVGLVAGFLLRDSACKAVAGGLFVQTMVYVLWPKSDYIVNHLTSKIQNQLWVKTYTHMSRIGNVGMMAGVIIFLLTMNKN